jgi:threonine/homoserine/homoserine lactone efflux protein
VATAGRSGRPFLANCPAIRVSHVRNAAGSRNAGPRALIILVDMACTSSIGLFVVYALALLIVPGPAVFYIIGRSIHQGRSAGLLSVLGICTGTGFHVLAAALGLLAMVRTSALAFSIVRFAGASYLIYLGIQAMRMPTPHDRRERRYARSGVQAGSTPMQIFRQGVLVNVLNPKTALFFLAFLPQFVDSNRGPIAGQVLCLGAIFVLLSLLTDSAYAFLAGAFGEFLQTQSRFRNATRYVTGAIFLTLGFLTAITSA